MLSTVFSAGLMGIDGFLVTIECALRRGLGSFEIVGLPDISVKEAKERVRAAFENSEYLFPSSEITVNMAPADLKKEGSSFELALFLSIFKAAEMFENEVDLSDKCFIGELSMSGAIRSIRGVLSMVLCAKSEGKKQIFVPKGNVNEASVVDGIEVFPVSSVKEIIDHLDGKEKISPVSFDRSVFEKAASVSRIDFSDVKGQERVKRAIEIAAAGNHNILLIGPPGTGKSMLAKRIPTILPAITFEEAVEATRIHSTAGNLKQDALLTERPFRSPHHTMSSVALAGGGKIPMPGEVSLAHNGILFLDELPEFTKTATEVLRQPTEDGEITITRAAGHFTFPSSFMLVCAMNPCKCGYFGDSNHKCTCKPNDIQKYLSKISGPLLDRIDIQVEVPSLNYDSLSDKTPCESSKTIRERVNKAREIALNRFKGQKTYEGKNLYSNADMTSNHIRKYCILEDDAKEILKSAFESLGLSARGYDRVLRVSRTIADLAESDTIKAEHIAEAIQLRSLDRKYF